MELSRRNFLTGALVGTAGAAGVLAGASSLAFGDEVDEAAEEAAEDMPAWLGVEPEVDESAIVETVECDVLVVGEGTAGLFAAGAAVDEGASVLVIEQSTAGYGIRNDLGAIGSAAQEAAGIEVNVNEVVFDIGRYACWDFDERVARTWATRSGEAIDWLEEVTAPDGFSIATQAYTGNEDMKFKCYPVTHNAVASDDSEASDAAEVVHDYIAAKGGEFRYETALVKLVKEDGRVVGAIATNADGDYVRINAAGGVIVCTGGYSYNADMMNDLQPQTRAFSAFAGFAPHMMGDGVKACLWAGAAMGDQHFCHTFDRMALPPDGESGEDYIGTGTYFLMGSQPFLKVNLDGERFFNESCLYDFTSHASATQRGRCNVMIWDANYQEHMEQFDTVGCSRVFPWPDGQIGSGGGIDTILAQMESLVESGCIQSGDTLEELAENLDIPAKTFAVTVARYNELCEAGYDEDFGKEAFRMIALDTPPYYGVRMSAFPMATMDGIRTDEYARALDEDRQVIAGLYVAGNDANSFFGHTYPNLYGGLNAGRCITFGRIAGQMAAAEASGSTD